MRPSQDPSITRKSHNRGKVVSSFLRDTSHRCPGADVPKNVLLPNRGYEMMTIRAEDNRSGGIGLARISQQILHQLTGPSIPHLYIRKMESPTGKQRAIGAKRCPPQAKLMACGGLLLESVSSEDLTSPKLSNSANLPVGREPPRPARNIGAIGAG